MENSQISFSGCKEYKDSPGTFVEGDEAKHLFHLITEEENLRLAIYLKSLPKPIDIISMKDHRNFTLLNYAAYKNVASCFKIVYEYALKFNINKSL